MLSLLAFALLSCTHLQWHRWPHSVHCTQSRPFLSRLNWHMFFGHVSRDSTDDTSATACVCSRGSASVCWSLSHALVAADCLRGSASVCWSLSHALVAADCSRGSESVCWSLSHALVAADCSSLCVGHSHMHLWLLIV